MHPADHYPMNHVPSQPEGTITLDSESELETTIALLKQRFEAVRQREVKRVLGRLGALRSTQENAIESFDHSIIARILHVPIAVCGTSCTANSHFVVIDTTHP